MRPVVFLPAVLLLGLGLVGPEVGLSNNSAAEKARPGALRVEWRPLFPKSDFTGWEGLMKHWSFVNDDLVGTNLPRGLPYRTFLCSKKRYKDFELKFQVRLEGSARANSGLNFRSEVLDRAKFTVTGPQADMGQAYWGALSSEFIPGKASVAIKSAPPKVLAKVKQKDFNDYYVKCVGKRVTIELNGETTVEGEFSWMQDEGILAWQVHANPTKVTFRNIRIRDLSPANSPKRKGELGPEKKKR